MPTYQYRREDGSIFEYFQGMNDEKLQKCPETGQKVVRLIGKGEESIVHGGTRSKGLDAYRKNPHLTTLSHYQKKIDRNSEKAREMRAKHFGE